ncbi:type IV pilus modification PilV family protein [Methylobacter sp.]|uniref:type IV pilus modification PilV family protein n=1 Tax=Methylobacter sp. TaxID=2051955 RepID=UPI003DA56A37
MKSINPIKNSTGIGLIEVLITTVVVAVGLLAIASLQGDLMNGSGLNKTRAEAKALCDTKIEELRDRIEKTGASGYDAIASSAANETITGTNETFSRGWVVTDLAGPARKQISATCGWPKGQVVVQSVVAFEDVWASGVGAQGQNSGVDTDDPSTNANSSEEIDPEIIDLPQAQTPNSIYDYNGKKYLVGASGTKAARVYSCGILTPFEHDLYTRRVDRDGTVGDEAIELFEKSTVATSYCIPKIRFNGGVIIPIRGIVHSAATDANNSATLLDVNLFTFNATESGTYCVFDPIDGAKSAPYVCYVGGNCKFGPAGTAVNGTVPVTECPNPTFSAAKVGPGGWRGKVGLLGVAPNGKNVCFAEELAGTATTLDTARNYYTRNNGLNEGINKPYSCHDFLIVNGQQNAKGMHNECTAQATAIGGFKLASKNIQRDITDNNVFDPANDTSYCVGSTATSYTVAGTVENANSAPTVTVLGGNCTATTTAYTCYVTTAETSLTVNGSYNGETQNCSFSLDTASGCTLSFTPSNNPTYTVTGIIMGAAAGSVSISLDPSGIQCPTTPNGDGNYTYNCTVTAADPTTATLTATASVISAAVEPATQAVTLTGASGTTITVPGPFVANDVPTYTISGSISIEDKVDNLTTVTVAVDTNMGACTLTGGHSAGMAPTYSCIVPGGDNHLTVAISPTCSAGNGSKKHQLSDGATTSLNGSLLIDLGNVSGNATKNITITKSNTNC